MKKISVAILTLFALSFVALNSPKTASAQNQWWKPNLTEFMDKVDNGAPDNEIFGERYTVAQVYWILGALTHAPLGDVASCLSPDQAAQFNTCFTDKISMTNSGGSSFVVELAQMNDALMQTKPASGIQYIAQKVNDLSPIQTAYAQNTNGGFGFQTLLPVQGLWFASRNLAFGLMAFVIIILAFMIMLRQKISPQAVITVQSALPKVAIALVVITFSYAIAGLLVDLSYVVLGIISAAFVSTGATNLNVTQFFNVLNNPIGGFTGFLGIVLNSILVGGVLATFGAWTGVGLVVGGASMLLGFIAIVLYIIALFRVFIVMLVAYAKSLFLIVGFPFIALLSVVSVGPGIMGWVRQFVAQLSVFIAICVSVAAAHMIFWYIGGQQIVQTTVAGANFYNFKVGGLYQANPAADSSVALPAFGGAPISLIGIFIGFGVLFSAPKIARAFSDQIQTGRGSYGFDSWGTMGGPAAGLTSGAIGIGKKAVSTEVGGQVNQHIISPAVNTIQSVFARRRGGSGPSGPPTTTI